MPKKRSDRERSPFGLRLKMAREAAGLTQMQACAKLGISQGTLTELEGVSASSGHVAQMAALYGVDPVWLATGDGQQAHQVQAPAADEESAILAAFRRLPPDSAARTRALGYVEGLAEGVRSGEFGAQQRQRQHPKAEAA